MPWTIRKRGDKWCVHKKGESSPVPGGCHGSRADAERHRRALYASEGSLIVSKMETTSAGSTSTFVIRGLNSATAPATSTFSNVTITVADAEEETAAAEEQELAQWEAVLGLEGHETADRRYLMPGEISERELPLTLMVQTVSEEGHKGSEVGGRIDSIFRVSPEEARQKGFNLDDVADDAVVIMANGVFDSSDFGLNSARMVEEEILRGVSFDLAVTEVLALDPDTHEPVEGELDLFDFITGNFVTGIKGSIMGATVVPFAAFEEAVIRPLTASGNDEPVFSVFTGFGIKITKASALVAAAAPLKPPAEWFSNPQLDRLTPLTITKDGRIFGHLADWSGCHTGSSGVCVPPPRSASGYAYFNVGEIETADGELVSCGKIMFSMTGGRHAPTDYHMTAEQVMAHYDDTTCVGGYVRAGSDAFGTWIAGALRPRLSEEEIQHLRTHPPSGDWRPVQGTTELVAAFSVPIPGFPIPRAEAYLVASAGSLEVTALITPPITEEVAEEAGWRSRKRKRKMLQQRVIDVLGVRPTPRARMRQEAIARADTAPSVAE